MSRSAPFTVRLSPEYHVLLGRVARLKKIKPAALAAQILEEGINKLLNPEEIEHYFDEEKAKLLAAAEEFRSRNS